MESGISIYGHKSSTPALQGRAGYPLHDEEESRPSEEAATQDFDPGYLIHKLNRQVNTPLIKHAGRAMTGIGVYRTHMHARITGENQDAYTRKNDFIYRDDNVFGRTFMRAMLPKKYRENLGDEGTKQWLKKSSAKFQQYATTVGIVESSASYLANAVALGTSISAGGSSAEITAVASDTASSYIDVVSTFAKNAGLRKICAGDDAGARSMLGKSMRAGVAIGALRAVSGVTRLGIETHRYVATGEFNGSSITYGAIDFSSGAMQTIYSSFLYKQASKAVSAEAANAVLTARAAALTPVMKVALRSLGTFGAAVGFVSSVLALRKTLKDGSLSEAERRKNLTSASVGLFASGLMLASALIIAPPLAPLAIGFSIAGTLVLAGQTIYDHYDEIASV